jgi:hypothetical protein
VAELSLIQQSRRFGDQAGQLEENIIAPTVTKDSSEFRAAQGKLHKAYMQMSDNSTGYIMFLNHSVQHLPPISELDVPFLQDVDRLSYVSDKSTLYTTAADISGVAKRVLDDLTTGKIVVKNPDDLFTLDWYRSFNITSNEVAYYEARDTPRKVLELLKGDYRNAYSWEPFPLPILTQDDQDKISQIRILHQAQIERANQISGNLLVANGHGAGSNEELITRYKNKKTVMVNSRSKKDKANKPVISAEERKRKLKETKLRNLTEAILGTNNVHQCSVMDCVIPVNTTTSCAECGLFFCADHFLHSVHSTIMSSDDLVTVQPFNSHNNINNNNSNNNNNYYYCYYCF